MARPTLSVIIPVHNGERHLGDALDSALRQEGGLATEVIVVDDGSTDGTGRLLESYGDQVRVVRQRNAGPSAARNRGVRVARGRWLAFLDADDVWAPDKLARQLARAAEEGAELVYSDRETFGEGPSERLSDDLVLPEGRIFEPLLLRNFITLSSVLMRRETFLRVGGFCEDLLGAEDWDLWLRHCARGEVAVCREPLVRYRRHAQSLTHDPDRMIAGHLRVVYRALSLEPARVFAPARIHEVFARNWLVCAGYAEPSRPRWAAACYLRALSHDLAAPRAYRGLVRSVLAQPAGARRTAARAAAGRPVRPRPRTAAALPVPSGAAAASAE